MQGRGKTMIIASMGSKNYRNGKNIADLIEGLQAWRIFSRLAWHDIKIRYTRTLLGPWWLIIGTSVWIIMMGLVMSTLFHRSIYETVPYGKYHECRECVVCE